MSGKGTEADVINGYPGYLRGQSAEICTETSGHWRRMGGGMPALCLSFIQCCRDRLRTPCTYSSRASVLNTFPIWEFLVGSGICL